MNTATTTIETREVPYYKAVAITIFKQLGGAKFTAMTGCKHIVYGKDEQGDAYLQMHMGRNKINANRIIITLTDLDLYNMEFYQVVLRKNGDIINKSLCKHTNLYDDMLQSTFTEVTGLRTHL